MMKKLLYILLLSFPSITLAQTDEINISAAFSTFIDLKIVGNANVQWTVNTLERYQNGFHPYENQVTFQVASSNSFSVEMGMTPLADPSGNEIDLKNIILRVFIPESRLAEKDVRFYFPDPDYIRETVEGGIWKSGDFFPTTTPKPIILPGSQGNAGSYEDNEFTLAIGLGAYNHTAQIGMKRLLDQNITPGTYTGTMTLTAIPEAL